MDVLELVADPCVVLGVGVIVRRSVGTALPCGAQFAQSAVDRNSGNAGFCDTLGLIYFKKGLYSQAVEQAKKAVALDAAESARAGAAANSAYRLRLGQSLAAAGDKSNARREVEIALQNQKDLSKSEVRSARNLLAGL